MASDPILELAEELLGDNTISIYVNDAERAERLMMAEHWVPATAEDIADRLLSRLRPYGFIAVSEKYVDEPILSTDEDFVADAREDIEERHGMPVSLLNLYVLESKKGGV